MRFKKALSLLLVCTQIAALASFGSYFGSQAVTGGMATATMADSGPVINGDLNDSVWSVSTDVAATLSGAPTQSAKCGILWDYTYLYIGVQVTGVSAPAAGSAWGAGDIVGIYLDPTGHKSAPYAAGDWQLGIGYNPSDAFTPYILMGTGLTNTQAARDALSRNVLAVTKKTANGWNAEIAIPWENLGIDPYLQKSMGFDLSVEHDVSGSVNSLIWYEGAGATNFTGDTSGFGELDLSSQVIHNTDGNVIYSENFDSYANGTLPANYTARSGQQSGWTVQNGKLVGSFNSSSMVECRLALPALGGNFVYQADMSFNAYVTTDRWTSIMYRGPRSSDQLGYYHFSNRFNGAGTIEDRTTDSNWETLLNTSGTSEAHSLTLNKAYHLTATVFGQGLTHLRTGTLDTEKFNHSLNVYPYLGTARPSMLASDVQKRGRFGLQVDRATVSYDNIQISKLEATNITVTGVPDSLTQMAVATPAVTVNLSDGETAVPVNLKDAKIYSSDQSVVKTQTDGTIKALKTGPAKIAVIVDNQLYEKNVTVTPVDTIPIASMTAASGLYTMLPGGSMDTSDIKFSALDGTESPKSLTGASTGMTLSSSDTTVVAVENGQLKALKAGTATLTAQIDTATATTVVWVKQSETDNTFVSADFESGALPGGWTKIGSTGSYAIKSASGNSYLELQPYTRILIPMPKGVGDYVIDADVTFTQASDPARWASIMYRVQNQDYPYFQFGLRQDTTAANGTEFAYRNPSAAWEVRAKSPFTGKMDYGTTRHMQIIATGNRVKQLLDGKLMEFTDQAGDWLSGDIGLQSDNVVVRFDNVRVQLNPAPLPAVPQPGAQFAVAKTVNANLVNCPTVTYNEPESLARISALADDDTTSSVLMDLKLENNQLNVYGETQKLGTIQEVIDLASGKITMMFRVDDSATADAFSEYISDQQLEDLDIVSDNVSLLTSFRAKTTTTRATLLIGSPTLTLADVYTQVANANTAKCRSVILPVSAATKDVVEQFQRRMQSVWVTSDDSVIGIQKAFTSGANGILTKDPAAVETSSNTYTGRTLLRRSFVVGHRGSPTYAPEDTMASYRLAVEKYGASMIENDVWLTKDKQVIVMHDGTFTRTTDILTNTKIPDSVFTNGVTRQNCTPHDLTLAQIKLLDAGSWFNSSYAGETIPALDEMFQYMQGKDVLLFLELKDTSQGIEQATQDSIAKYNVQNQVDVITFNTGSIPIMESVAPGLSVATLNSSTMPDSANPRLALRDLLKMVLPMNAVYAPSYNYISNAGFITEANARGVQLFGWTYADKASFAWAIDHGISGLTTNNVDWAQNYAFTLEPGQESYNLTAGDTANIYANKITNGGQKISCDPEVIVLSGKDVLSADSNTLTAKKAGSAAILLRAKSTMDSATYDIYTQPVVVRVAEAPIPSEPSEPSTPSEPSEPSVPSTPSTPSVPSESSTPSGPSVSSGPASDISSNSAQNDSSGPAPGSLSSSPVSDVSTASGASSASPAARPSSGDFASDTPSSAPSGVQPVDTADTAAPGVLIFIMLSSLAALGTLRGRRKAK